MTARPIMTLLVCAAVVTAGAQTTAPPPVRARDLDVMVGDLAAKFSAPGVAVAVVKDGATLLSRGYGISRIDDETRVDEHTLFYTASATKAFTVTALGILADEGRLRIDDPVVKHLPEFTLADRALRDALTIRDLMAHRTGVARSDLLLVSGKSSGEILRALGALEAQAPLRSRFTYQNQMYLVLGLLLEKLGGTTWTKFVEDRVLRPIGFVDGNAAGLGHWGDRRAATPHARTPAGVVPIALVARDGYGAGGVNASATDLAAWLAFQLGDGTAGGTRIVNANVLAAQHSPNILVGGNASMPSAVLNAYGLGWFVHDYFGHRIVQHGGNGEGWTSLVLLVPQQRLGVAVMTNVHQSAAPTAIAYSVVDRILGRPARDYGAEYALLEAKMAPPPLPPPTAPLAPIAASMAGAYEHPVYGRATLTIEQGRMVFAYGTLRGAVDGTMLTWLRSDMAAVLGPGRLSARSGADGVRLVLEAGGERFEFTRLG